MQVAIGLPSLISEADGRQIVEFARRAEAAGFSSLGTLDRLVYGGYEPLTTLAAAAAVTDRIPLVTTVLLAPYRLNAALLAKEAASVHRLSGGRLTLGLGLGWREDDYEASGARFSQRGRKLDEMLAEIERVWRGEEFGFAGGIGPNVAAGPPRLLIGGSVEASFKRAATHGIGWILGGGTPDQAREGKQAVAEEWRRAGRDGDPYIGALAYFSLGPDAQRNAESYLGHYYAARGEETAQRIVASAAKDAATVQSHLDAYGEAGVDELFLFPCSPDPDQVELLAEAASVKAD